MSLIDLSSPQGIDRFFYGQTVPERGTVIAQITSSTITPAQKVSIVNIPYNAGNLNIWIYSNEGNPVPDFTIGNYNVSVNITGSNYYVLENQFFELTNRFDTDGNPLYYSHTFMVNSEIISVGTVTILDMLGNVVKTITVNSSTYLHSMDGAVYQIRYYNSTTGVTETALLNYAPVFTNYTFIGNVLTVPGLISTTYAIRFTQQNGYQVLTPYNTPSYLPWYPRIRFGEGIPPREYFLQNFNPIKPYLFGSYISGTVLSDSTQNFPNVIEFDRLKIYQPTVTTYPDILIFDQYGNFKNALSGSNTSSSIRGNLYHWEDLQINSIDAYKARVQVKVPLETTDIVYGFYSYEEDDINFTSLDINPITNPSIINNIIYFYYRPGSVYSLFYQMFSSTGTVSGATNDTLAPPTWNYVGSAWVPSDSSVVFSNVQVGNGYSNSDFTVNDVRVRGGGLTSSDKNIPVSNNFWDCGYLDGRPYPIGGTLVIYLPLTLQNVLTKDQIRAKVLSILPEGVYPTIRYVDQNGNETA